MIYLATLQRIRVHTICLISQLFQLSKHTTSYIISDTDSVVLCGMTIDKALIITRYTQKKGAVSKVNKKFISHLTRAQRTPSAAATVQVSHALPAVRFSCLLRGRGGSFQDGVAAGKGFLCAAF